LPRRTSGGVTRHLQGYGTDYEAVLTVVLEHAQRIDLIRDQVEVMFLGKAAVGEEHFPGDCIVETQQGSGSVSSNEPGNPYGRSDGPSRKGRRRRVYERVLPIGFPGFVKSKTLIWMK
jgi:hypothetical protein